MYLASPEKLKLSLNSRLSFSRDMMRSGKFAEIAKISFRSSWVNGEYRVAICRSGSELLDLLSRAATQIESTSLVRVGDRDCSGSLSGRRFGTSCQLESLKERRHVIGVMRHDCAPLGSMLASGVAMLLLLL
jgi:hypothetical protein